MYIKQRQSFTMPDVHYLPPQVLPPQKSDAQALRMVRCDEPHDSMARLALTQGEGEDTHRARHRDTQALATGQQLLHL